MQESSRSPKNDRIKILNEIKLKAKVEVLMINTDRFLLIWVRSDFTQNGDTLHLIISSVYSNQPRSFNLKSIFLNFYEKRGFNNSSQFEFKPEKNR